jgi:hypothetical protein
MASLAEISTKVQGVETEEPKGSNAEETKSSKTDASKGSEAGGSPLRKFTIFNLLPQETKDAIWKHAVELADPRVVEIRQGFYKHMPDGTPKWTGQHTSTCPIPGVLQACRDSRQQALMRWKLSFACESQPAKIFFDLKTDTLYFGHEFDDLNAFVEECNKRDRLALRKIAFQLLKQYESEYYEDGTDLAVNLRRDFRKLNEVVLVEKDVNYDWARHERGRAQRRPNPRKTVVTFRQPERTVDGRTLSEFVAKYTETKWRCPEVKQMDYEKSYPQPLGFDPWKEPDDEDDETYQSQMLEQDEQWSEEEDSSDEEGGLEMGGWLEEVPDLQLRLLLAMNPELRSQFGY